MSEKSLDELMAELNADSGTPAVLDTAIEEPVKAEEVKPEPEVVPEVTPNAEEDPLAGLLVGEDTKATEEAPEPVKKRRGRPKGSTTAKKTPAKETEPVEEAKDEAPEEVKTEAQVEVEVKEQVAPELAPQPKDIYITAETQIFNGHVYRRGQKITFTPGDKFYNSQFDRDGKNWLDIVDDLDAQYAYFGRVVVQPDRWLGIPLGATEGVEHPGLALALAKIAQEEYERNGTPYN